MKSLGFVRGALLLAMAVGVSFASSAENTWYVAKGDANAADTLDTGRGTAELPFRTIQAALDWRLNGPQRVFTVEVVDGGGVMSVCDGDEPVATVTAADGAREFSLPVSSKEVSMSYSFEGEGRARLYGFSSRGGMMFYLK